MMAEERQLLHQALLLASPDAVLLVNTAGRIEMASPVVERLFGYRPEDLVGKTIEMLIPEQLRTGHAAQREAYSARPIARSMGSGLELYGQRRDASTFPIDVSLAPITTFGETRVCAFVRNATERRRNEDLQRYLNEVSRQLLAGGPTDETVALIASRARAISSTAAAWVVLPDPAGGLVVAAADGVGSERVLGATLSSTVSLSARAMAEGKALAIADMASEPEVLPEARVAGLGPGLYLPMLAEEGAIGALVVARLSGEEVLDAEHARAVEAFASAASVVISLARARGEIEELSLVAEHERIARDLHDSVIQRLFAVGMSLQAMQRLADPLLQDRIGAAVDSIDDVVREIRETIFELNLPDSGGPNIRQLLREVSAEAAPQLGFEPRVGFRGPVETAVTLEQVPHLLAVAREALSNTARHALAKSAELVLAASDGFVCLTAADDGVGVPDGPSAGHGLPNMDERAKELGGELRVVRRHPAGTIVEWRVPQHVRVAAAGTPSWGDERS